MDPFKIGLVCWSGSEKCVWTKHSLVPVNNNRSVLCLLNLGQISKVGKGEATAVCLQNYNFYIMTICKHCSQTEQPVSFRQLV